MNGKLSIIVIVILALGLVASVGNMNDLKKANAELLSAAEEIAAPIQNVISQATSGTSATPGDDGQVAKLKATIESREDRIAELARELEEARRAANTAVTTETAKEEPRESRTERYANYMEKLKEEDPEKFKEFEDRRTRMHDHMKDTLARQSSFILEMDTKHMTDEQLANHESLAEIMQQNWKNMEMIQTEGAAQEDVSKARRDMMMSMRDMGSLLKSEREVALASYGRELGLNQGDNDAFSNDIRGIMDMTSLQSYWSGWGGRGGRGGSRGGQEGGR